MQLSDYVASFWARVDKSGECWVWDRPQQHGYGRMTVEGKDWYAHRLAWTWLRGPIPAGLEIDHLCRNRACVNPDHLEPVTHRENQIRGEGIAGRARRTHCIRGHEFTEANTGRTWRGTRKCRACDRLSKVSRVKLGPTPTGMSDEARRAISEGKLRKNAERRAAA